MKTIVLALLLLIPAATWAQKKEEAVDPQHLKMLKAGRQAESEASTAGQGINKGRREQGPGPAAESGSSAGAGAAEKAARPAKQESQ